MSVEPERMDRLVGALLRTLRAQGGRTDFQSQAREILELITAELPGALGAFLLSTVPLSKPERPIRSSGWRPEAFRDPEQLRALAEYLGQCKATKYVSLHESDAPVMDWLPRALSKPGAAVLAICPLRQFVPRDFRDIPALQLILALVFTTPPENPPRGAEGQGLQKENLEVLGWLLAQIRVNWESGRIARRSRVRAEAVDHGTHQILAEGPLLSNVREHFRELVARIQRLMNCDTCQLYLLPRYAEGIEPKKPDDRIWLVAEKTAEREGLRYRQSDLSLTSLLWREPDLSPLNRSNLFNDAEYGKFALGKVGLTRHILGMLLRGSSSESEALGVIILRDKFGPDPRNPAHNAVAQEGFTQEDEETLRAHAAELTPFLEAQRGSVRREHVKRQLRNQVEALRNALHADACQLYLSPGAIGRDLPLREKLYVELFVNARHNWAGDANYASGDGLTAKVFETGEPAIVEDGLGDWRRLERQAEEEHRRRPGKYRVSQHLLAVKVARPPFPAESEYADKPIGVLKVRDRLRSDGKTLSLEPFSSEDLHTLRAFAHMISVAIAIGEYARQREIEEMLRHCYMTEEFLHDIGSHVLEPLTLNLPKDLSPELQWLPEYLEMAKNMFYRSLVAATIAANRRWPEQGAYCDLRAVLRDLFPQGDASLEPDRERSKADVRLSAPEPRLADALRIRCEQRLIEVIVLVLPVWLYHYADAGSQTPELQVDVFAEPSGDRAKLRFKARVSSKWLDEAPIRSQDMAYLVYYPHILVCPSIPFNTFQEELSFYGAHLRGDYFGGETQMWIEFDRVGEQRR